MARSTSALHNMTTSERELENVSENKNSGMSSKNAQTPSPKKFQIRRLSTGSTKSRSMLSDSEVSAVESDSSRVTPRRSRKVWTEAEEAFLISGVEKYGEHWEAILNDEELKFNDRVAKDLKTKYRALVKSDSSVNSNVMNEKVSIFDIRSVNERVTEVFIGPDWSRAQWTSSETVEGLEGLLEEFEAKIAAKQKMIARISPARTPSRFLSNLALNGSTVKRGRNNHSGTSDDSQDEFIGTPLKKTRGLEKSLTGSPLSISAKSTKSTKSQDALMVHSDVEETLVYPNEEEEPVVDEKRSLMNRCIIM